MRSIGSSLVQSKCKLNAHYLSGKDVRCKWRRSVGSTSSFLDSNLFPSSIFLQLFPYTPHIIRCILPQILGSIPYSIPSLCPPNICDPAPPTTSCPQLGPSSTPSFLGSVCIELRLWWGSAYWEHLLTSVCLHPWICSHYLWYRLKGVSIRLISQKQSKWNMSCTSHDSFSLPTQPSAICCATTLYMCARSKWKRKRVHKEKWMINEKQKTPVTC